MRARQNAALAALLATCMGLAGCPSGDPKILPPAPTASPGSTSVFIYVAEATDPLLGPSGGRVSAYQLGADGLLPAAPFASAPVVNPRRLIKHPVLPVLYVAGLNQIFAFDIARGTLTSRCGDGGLAPPCATDPRPGAQPIDMSIAQTGGAPYILYVVEEGSGNNSSLPTRVAAFELGSRGELPGEASSQASSFESLLYQGAAVLPDLGLIWIADTQASQLVRNMLDPDGNLPNPAISPTPVGAATPTPTPTPSDPTPTPSPSPTTVRAFGPTRILPIMVPPSPAPGTGQTVLYVIQRNQGRFSAYPVSTPIPDQPLTGGDIGDDKGNPTSESNTRGTYNALLVDPGAGHIYGALFNFGRVDFYQLVRQAENDPDNPNGNIDDQTLGSTFSDTSLYPTGLACLPDPTSSEGLCQTIFVSVGGGNRVDAYAVQPDGSLPERPFSSTQPIEGTFPADVLVYVP